MQVNQTVDLYTPADVAKVRELLLKEQGEYDAVTGLLIPKGQAVCDHWHDDQQFVRGVLHRQINAFEGKVRNAYDRLIKWWYPHELPQVLRLLADYLERSANKPDKRYRHPNWMKKLQVMFNKLTTKQRDTVLAQLGYNERCTNDTQRKKVFAALLKDKNLGYTKILTVIDLTKG